MKSQQSLVVLSLLVGLIAVGVTGLQCHSKRQGPQDSRDRQPGPEPAAAAKGGAVIGESDAAAAVESLAEKKPSTAGAPPQKQQGSVKSGPPTAETMRAWLDAGQTNEALEQARQLMKSNDAEVRSQSVHVLGRIGLKALPELSDLVTDQDGAVSRAAFLQWKGIVSAIPDEAMKSRIVLAGMSVLDDKAKLNELAAVLSALPKPLSLRSLSSLVQAANPYAAEVAREHYALMTGEPYTTPQAAEIWIQANGAAEDPARTQAERDKVR